jgi:ABC-2 type transport system permease protein
MIFRIARKELLDLWRDGRSRNAGVIVALLLVAALVTGWRQAREFEQQQRFADQAAREQWEQQDAKNPHSAAHFGTYAFKTPTPLAYLDRGIDNYLGIAVWIEAHKQNPFLYRPVEDATSVARFGEATAASILQILVPLLLILLAFSAFAGERESGTLRQLLSLGLDGRVLLLGKALGILSALALLLAPAILLGCGALVWQGTSALTTDSLLRFGLLAAVYALYFSIVVGAALLVSMLASSSRTALVILLVCWIGNCLIVPRLAADLSERLYPTPDGEAFQRAIEREMKDGVDGHDPSSARAEELRQQLLKQYGVSKVEDLPLNFIGLAMQAGEEYGNRVYDRRYAELWGIYERQQRVHRALTVFAPLNALRPLSAGLAGTDFAAHRHFAIAAEQYRRLLNKQMNDALTYQSRSNGTAFKADSSLWQSTPKFSYAAPSLPSALQQHRWHLGLLLVWATVVWLAALRVAARLRT